MNLVALLDRLRRTSRSRVAVALALTGLFLVPLQVTAGAITPSSPATPEPTDECEPGDLECEWVPCEPSELDPECEWVPCEPGDPDPECEPVPCEPEDLDPECEPVPCEEGDPDPACGPEPEPEPQPKPKPSTDKPVPAKPNFTG